MPISFEIPANAVGANIRLVSNNGTEFFQTNYGVVSSNITIVNGGVPIVMSPLVDGETAEDITNYASIIDPANYETDFPSGTISNVLFELIVGSSEPGEYLVTDTLAVDDFVGYRVTVTDSNNSTQEFFSDFITVGSTGGGFTPNISAGRYLRFDLDPDFAGSNITFPIADAEYPVYNGDYTVPAASIEDNGPPAFLPGTVIVGIPDGRADASEIVAGDVCKVYPGLIVTQNVDTTFSTEVLSDGEVFATSTGIEPFDVIMTPSQNGTTITATTTVDDGVNTPISLTSAGIDIPFPVSAGPLSYNIVTSERVIPPGSGTTATLSAFDLSSVPEDDYCIIFVAVSTAPSTEFISGLTIDGESVLEIEHSPTGGDVRAEMAAYRYQKGSNDNPDIVIGLSSAGDVDECSITIIHVVNFLGELMTRASNGVTTSVMNLNVNVVADGLVLTGIFSENDGLLNTFTGVNLDTNGDVDFPGQPGFRLGSIATTSPETPRIVQANLADDSRHNAGISVSIY